MKAYTNLLKILLKPFSNNEHKIYELLIKGVPQIMKQFVFLIDTGNEKTEYKITASGMTEAVAKIKEVKNEIKKSNPPSFKIQFKGVIYENAS